MKIVPIFAIVEESLLAVQFADKDGDELSETMNAWNDIEYLQTFFLENESYLKSSFYQNISKKEAIEITLEEAEELENLLLTTAEKGKIDPVNGLQTIFKLLDNNE